MGGNPGDGAEGCPGLALQARQLPPEFVVGCEGLFGLAMMLAVVLPVVYYIPFASCEADWCKVLLRTAPSPPWIVLCTALPTAPAP